MLHYADTDIVFQEIPDEVTLAVNLTGCPCRCPGCHSRHLWEDCGEPLTDEAVETMLSRSDGNVSCVAFMGGDAAADEIDGLARRLRRRHPMLHTAWYSGRSLLSPLVSLANFDYIKLGPYLAHLGPLNRRTTNQRLYHVEQGHLHDITARFWRQ